MPVLLLVMHGTHIAMVSHCDKTTNKVEAMLTV